MIIVPHGKITVHVDHKTVNFKLTVQSQIVFVNQNV